jgi:hypothetical protein
VIISATLLAVKPEKVSGNGQYHQRTNRAAIPIRDQERSDRELLVKNRGIQRQATAGFRTRAKGSGRCQSDQKSQEEPVRAAGAGTSQGNRAAQGRRDDGSGEQFNEARAKEKEPSDPQTGSK